ncbi:MAG: hypothetical protein KatS3mg001_505 [Candidatus Pacearchaeota archaeon]|nr:MAG: hypothetical protein KatS3mg001_505 [Candidatus Pacearchaeota archaeon]
MAKKLNSKKLKLAFIIFSFIYLVFLVINFVSADDSPLCFIISKNNCDPQRGKYFLFEVSSNGTIGGAHVAKNNNQYGYAVCCSFDPGERLNSCDDSNEMNTILRLSGANNAHAERREQYSVSSYGGGNRICFSNINETFAANDNTQAGTDSVLILRLSNFTNAHLQIPDGNYEFMVFGKLKRGPGQCDLTSAIWEKTQTANGTYVNMTVEGSQQCAGQTITFDILDKDGKSCKAGQISGCIPPQDINFPAESTNVNGTWKAAPPGENYTFVANVSGTSESVTSNNKLSVYLTPPWCQQLQITLCSQYNNENDCNNNVCLVNPQGQIRDNVDCSDPNVNCGCSWSNSDNKCKVSWSYTDPNTEKDVGKCTYTQTTDDDCSDGLLIVNLTANWTWDQSCDQNCQQQYSYLQNQCTSGLKSVECPAQIALPFFGFYQFVLALVIIAAIYFVVVLRRNALKKRAFKRSGKKIQKN